VAASGLGAHVARESGHELFSPSMVFHGLRVGFRVGEDVAFMINDGGAGTGRLSLLRGNVLQGMLVVNLDSMSE